MMARLESRSVGYVCRSSSCHDNPQEESEPAKLQHAPGLGGNVGQGRGIPCKDENQALQLLSRSRSMGVSFRYATLEYATLERLRCTSSLPLSLKPVLPPLYVSHQLCRPLLTCCIYLCRHLVLRCRPLLLSRVHLRRRPFLRSRIHPRWHLILRRPTVVIKLVLVVLGPPLRQRWCNLTVRLALVRFERDFLCFRRLPCVAFAAVEQPEDDEGDESCYTDGCSDAGFAAGGEPGGW